MSLFGSRRHRSEADALKEQVTALQAALIQCKTVVRRWTGMRLIVAVAAVSLAVGFALGVYNEPIREGMAGLARGLGFAGWVQDFDSAQAAYQRGRYATALRRLRPLADEGDARAHSLLGLMYAGGRGVPRDDAEAVKRFRLAADRGDPLGQSQLGLMYAKGLGVPQDQSEAARLYRMAAEQGYAQAQHDLGFLYATGEGVPQDYVAAHMWFNLAAARFPASDARNRRAAVANREAAETKMTRDQILEAQRLAREWRPK
jgi:hypothetical protein